MSLPPVPIQQIPPPVPPTQPSRFWRAATVFTLGVYTLFMLVMLGVQVVGMLRGGQAPQLSAQDVASLAVEQADRILNMLDVVFGIIGLLLPLGLGVVVYIYTESNSTIEENRTTITRLSEQTASAMRDAARSADIVEDLRGQVASALKSADEAVERDKKRDEETTRLQTSIDKQRKEVDTQRIEAEMRDKKRDEESDLLQERIEQQRQTVQTQSDAVAQLQGDIKSAYDATLALRRQMKVVDVILDIRGYEVTLLSEEYDTVSKSLNTLIYMTDIDEDDEENIESQHVRRREAVHALATLCRSPYTTEWLPMLMAKAIQHLEQMSKNDPVMEVRTEARRALHDFNGSLNGKNSATSSRSRKPKTPAPSDSPTNTD